MTDARIREAIAAMAAARAPASFCPSEVARELTEDWRMLMPQLREVAGAMQDDGALQATQGGRPVDPRTAAGPIRLSAPDQGQD